MIDNTKEYIACSAIYYDDGKHYPFMNTYGIDTGFVICGFRHPMIIAVAPTNPVRFKEKFGSELLNEEQGFMTSLGRFVDRHEGMRIAVEVGQVDKSKEDYILFSEDLFPEQAIYSRV